MVALPIYMDRGLLGWPMVYAAAGAPDALFPVDPQTLRAVTGAQVVDVAEAFLFQADRAQHFAVLVIPALDEGKLVITDRCFDASIAYQGYGRGVGVELIERLSLLATRGIKPDLTILLDLDPSQVHQRTDDASGQREERTRFDAEAEDFHRRVQEGFRMLARKYPERVKVVDASRTVEEIHQEIVELVQRVL